jgi:hypothetical protein
MSEFAGVPAGFIPEAEMARRLGKCVATLRAWGKRGYGPKRFHNGKDVIYRTDGDIRWPRGHRAGTAA